MSGNQAHEYQGVVASNEFIAAADGSNRIPRSRIRSIRFMFGSPVEHPFFMFLLGLLLVGAGLYPIPRITHWIMHGGPLLTYEVLLIVWLPFGAMALYEATLRVPILLVRTAAGKKRLRFYSSARRNELQQFLHVLETEFGYSVLE